MTRLGSLKTSHTKLVSFVGNLGNHDVKVGLKPSVTNTMKNENKG